jgi:LEA14-like dessication related protein
MKTIMSTIAISLIFLSACSTSKDLQEPEFRDIQNVRLDKVGVLQTSATVDLIYYNPNDNSVTISDARGDIYLDGAYLGHFDLKQPVKVRKNSEFSLPVTFKLDNVGAIKNQRDIYKKKEALVKIDGLARLKKAGFSKDITIRYEKMQNIERFRTLVSR